MPDVTLKECFTTDYYTGRAKYQHGKWLTVTFTPKGSDISTQVMIDRLDCVLSAVKGIDFYLLVPELSKANVFHFHGFLHVTNPKHKLTFLKSNDLVQLLVARQGPPEGWINYIFKGLPQWYYANKLMVYLDNQFSIQKILRKKFSYIGLRPYKKQCLSTEDSEDTPTDDSPTIPEKDPSPKTSQ